MYTITKKINLLRKHMEHEHWFVLYTRPNFEKIIYKKLRELGFNAYLPLRKDLRHWNDRTVWIETPLFRSYLFIKTNFMKKDMAFKVSGILNYVSFGSHIAVLNEEEIDRIKKLCSYPGRVTINFENLGVGNKVEILDGVLKGLKGFLTDTNNSSKIHINIESLNCFASVMIDSDSVSLKYI